MASYSIEINDMVPEATRTAMVLEIEEYVRIKTMEVYALSKSQVEQFDYDPVLTQGRAVIRISVDAKAYAKRVLTRIYQNSLFDNWLSLHVTETVIILTTDGIENLSDLELALQDPV